jgi:voltage-gated potassium channel
MPFNRKSKLVIYSAPEQTYRRIRRDLSLGIAAFVGVTVIGTLGYKWIEEGWSWLDAAYMTVITLATVGFSEVSPLTQTGRLFTIVLILMGIVSLAFIANRFTEAMVQGYFQVGIRLRRQRYLIDQLSHHYILCGFGRTGQQVALEFAAEGIDFVVIDLHGELVEVAHDQGYRAIQGDATLDEALLRAGVDRAACLVTALPSDAENLYTVLSAKTLNPSIRAIARASTLEAVKKLERGGADVVISPYVTGGKRMAASALRPQVMDFLEGIVSGAGRSFYLEELKLDTTRQAVVGKTLREANLRQLTGALVVAIKREDGTLITGPTAETQLLESDILICMGTGEQLRRLNRLLSPVSVDLPRTPKLRSQDSEASKGMT